MACLATLMAAPRDFFLLDGELRHALHELGHVTRFAQKLGLRVFQISGVWRLGKQLPRALDQGIQLVHIDSWQRHQQGLVPFKP